MGGTMLSDPGLEGLRKAMIVWADWKRREAKAMLRLARIIASTKQ
jgi:hypothetical protein